MEDLQKLRNEIKALSKSLACLYLLMPAATRWTPNHNSIYGDQYKPGVLVWYDGFIYRCKVANNSSSIANPYFWEKMRPGLLLEEEQSDWFANPDRTAFIRNKPTKLSQFIDDIGASGISEEVDPIFQAWLDSDPLDSYYLASNPAGYISSYSETDPVFQAWLASNPLTPYLLASVAATTYYPLTGNPSGFLTDVTGMIGSGTVDFLPKFLTPNTIGDSRFSDNGANGFYGDPLGNAVVFLAGANTFLRVQRGGTNFIDFIMGNSGINQTNDIESNNTYGLSIKSKADTYFYQNNIEALKLLTTGQIVISQVPATGLSSDMIVVREVATGNLRQISIASLGAGTYLPLAGGTMTGDIIQPNAPTNAFHLANKNYIDNLITGITWKGSVRVATTTNITLSGLQTVDGISLVAGNRVLVKNQTLSQNNGIYIVSAGAWTRATDCDSAAELETTTVLVTLGTANKNTQWTESLAIVTIGTDPVTFVQIAGAGVYTNGSGITLTGNVFSIAALAITNSMINDVDWSKVTGTPTTRAGYGITDAYPLTGNPAGFLTSLGIGSSTQAWDGDLDAIAALSGASGLLKKTGANTWVLDTNVYITAITSGMITTALGYTPEDTANKSTSTSDSASTVKFPVWSVVVSYITGLGYLLSSTASTTYRLLIDIFATTLTSLPDTITLAQANSWIRVSVSSNGNLTIPPNSSVPIPIGSYYNFRQSGVGTITLVPGAGVTLNAPSNVLSTGSQYDVIRIIKQSTDSWMVEVGAASWHTAITAPALALKAATTYVDAQDTAILNSAKAYTDSQLTAMESKANAAYASTSALPSNTYNNGSSGVGATLTGNVNGPLLVDGVTIVVGQVGERVLVAGESTPANNGWYTITQIGTVAISPYILTRATDSDTGTEIGAGYLTSIIAPTSFTPGSSNNGKIFISVANVPFTVGTTAITFSQIGSVYSAGTGISLSGTTFSLTDVSVGGFVNGLTGKTTPVDADTTNISDSADSNKSKKVTWANIKATLKTYFDTLYAPKGFKYLSTTQVSLTGTVTETQLLQIPISANSLNSVDFLRTVLQIAKTGTAGNCVIRIKMSTSATMTTGTPTTIGQYQLGSTILFAKIVREFTIGSGNISGFTFTSSTIDDAATSISAIGTAGHDVTVQQYLYISATLGNAADQVVLNAIKVVNG